MFKPAASQAIPEQEQLIEPGPFAAAGVEEPALETEGSAVQPDGSSVSPVAPAAPLFRGIQREITSMEELTKYTLELEKQTLEQQARLSGMSGTAPAPVAAEIPYGGIDPKEFDRLGEEFILNPGNAVKKITDMVRASVLGDVAREGSTKNFYDAFYEANEDLVGCEDLVEVSVAQNQKAWEKIPTAQAAKLLASDVRARVMKIRGSAPLGVALPSTPAHALPSGGIASVKPAPVAPAPKLSFADQLKSQQAKHKKRA